MLNDAENGAKNWASKARYLLKRVALSWKLRAFSSV